MSTKYKTCRECNGTGIDDVDASLACWNCDGEGVVARLTNQKIKLHKKGKRRVTV